MTTEQDPNLTLDGEFRPVPDVTARQVTDLRRRFPDRLPPTDAFTTQAVAFRAGAAAVVRLLARSSVDPLGDDVDVDEVANRELNAAPPTRRRVTAFERSRHLRPDISNL